MNTLTLNLWAAALSWALATGHAGAHEGHDHAAEPARASAAASAAPTGLPRLSAVSPDFELVGVLDGRQLKLWLDRADTNAPVVQGSLELELGETKLQARPQGDVWVATLPADPAPGTLSVIAMVAVDGATDLLAGELVLPAPAAAPSATSWLDSRLLQVSGAVLALALLLAVAGWRLRRRAA